MRGRALLLKIVTFCLALTVFCTLGVVIGAGWIYFKVIPELPSIERLEDVKFQVPLRVYSRNDELLAEFGEKRRIPLAIEETPDTLINAFIASEDDRFRVHPGVDYQGIVRAGLTLLATGKKEQGGSTITMQVARNFFLTPEKTYTRKLREILLALQIERLLNKDQILELYLNKIYLGNRAYGVAAAAQIYYGGSASDLTLAQSAMVAGLPKAPSRFNPLANPERSLVRRNYVLGRMLALGFIDRAQHEEALAAPISAKRYAAPTVVEAPYLAEMVRARVVQMFGEEDGYTGGYKVYTTLDSAFQSAANVAVRNGLFGYEARHGYRGPAANVLQSGGAVVTGGDTDASIQLAELQTRLAQFPRYEPALPVVVIELSETGAVAIDIHAQRLQLPFEHMLWAKRRLDGDRLGREPERPAEVLSLGDVVYVAPAAKGTWRLVQLPEVEGSLVSLDPQNGAVRSLVGGFSFNRSKFNRAVQAFRQPGSNFKPFIYSAALHKGYTAATLVNDAPVVFDDPALEGVWRPENYSGKIYGPTRLREGLVKSRNLVSVRVLISLGTGRALDYAERFGFRSDQLPRDLSLVLGSGAVTPMQLARAYAVFANGGYLVQPYFIERIEDGRGEVVYAATSPVVCPDCADIPEVVNPANGVTPPAGTTADASDSGTAVDELPAVESTHPAPRAIPERNAYIMRSMLRDVINYGTGRGARVLRRNDIAGKTGTTNDQRDTWFSGFNSQLVTTVWLGYDGQKPLGNRETGGRAALPIWIDFMRVALADAVPDKIAQPDGLVTALIDRNTGEVTTADNPERMFEVFRAEHAPKPKAAGTAPVADSTDTGKSGQAPPEQLF